MSHFIPASTHAVESCIISAPIDSVWATVSSLDFAWWDLVGNAALKHGSTVASIGAVVTIRFRDGVTWDIQVQEISNIRSSITFEVISSEPSATVTSAIHTIRLRRISATNGTFVEWITDFSNDATAEVISDSRFKRLEGFNSLSVFLSTA